MPILAVNFGESKAGLATVGYSLDDSDGNEVLARTTGGVQEKIIGGNNTGMYWVFASNVGGAVLTYWDTGDASPLYAVSDYHPGAGGGPILMAIPEETMRIYRGDDTPIMVPSLGDISDYTRLYFGIKGSVNDPDSSAIILVEVTDGLLYLNGESVGNPTLGSLTVDDPIVGDIIVTIEPEASQNLIPGDYQWGVTKVSATTRRVIAWGFIEIAGDVARAIS